MLESLKKWIASRVAIKHLQSFYQWVNGATSGKKVYLAILVFAIDGLGDFLNAEISPEEFFDVIWQAFMMMAGRSAIKKVEK